MITLKKIQLNNFLSHENTKIEVGEGEKTLIDGKSGSGKSTLLDAVIWNLYGESRVDNKSLIRRAAKNAEVTVELNDGSTTFVITRSVSVSGKHTLTARRKEGNSEVPVDKVGIKDIQQWIEEELLHASYPLFINSVAYPQDNIENFVRQNATRRKDLLLEIVKIKNIDEYYATARELLTARKSTEDVLKTEISGLEDVILKGEETVKEESVLLVTLETHKNAFDMNSNKYSEVETKLEIEHQKLSRYTDLKILEKDFTEEHTSHIERLRKINSQVGEIISLYGTPYTDGMDLAVAIREAEERRDKIKLDLSHLRTHIDEADQNEREFNLLLRSKPNEIDYDADIQRLGKQIEELTATGHSCPAGDKCPFVKPTLDLITRTKSYLEEKKEAKQKQAREIAAFNIKVLEFKKIEVKPAARENLKKYEESLIIYNELNKLPLLMESAKEYIEARDRVVEKLWKVAEELKQTDPVQISTVDKNIIEYTAQLKALELEIGKNAQAVTKTKTDLDWISRFKDQLSVDKKSLADKQKEYNKVLEEVDALESIKEAFGSKGIKTVAVDYLIPRFEEKVNDILSQLSDFRIRLETQKSKANDDGMIEGLFIQIFNEIGELHDYNAFSGGEKVRISISISEALASLQKCGFRLIDEAIVSLDKESTENFVAVLQKIQSKFSQVLCISHVPEIKEIFDKRIEIVKQDGISVIR